MDFLLFAVINNMPKNFHASLFPNNSNNDPSSTPHIDVDQADTNMSAIRTIINCWKNHCHQCCVLRRINGNLHIRVGGNKRSASRPTQAADGSIFDPGVLFSSISACLVTQKPAG
jgi:hypothetical protein